MKSITLVLFLLLSTEVKSNVVSRGSEVLGQYDNAFESLDAKKVISYLSKDFTIKVELCGGKVINNSKEEYGQLLLEVFRMVDSYSRTRSFKASHKTESGVRLDTTVVESGHGKGVFMTTESIEKFYFNDQWQISRIETSQQC